MEFDNLIEYLSKKGDKTRTETLSLQALKDLDFMSEGSEFNFARHIAQFTNVLNNPVGYDLPDNEVQRGHYDRAIQIISSTYISYLYDKKGKYSNLTNKITTLESRIKQANDALDNIEEVSKAISGAKILAVYAEEYKTRSENYEDIADGWMKKLYISFGVLGAIVVLFFFFNIINFDFLKGYIAEDLLIYGYVAVIAIKVIVLIGLIQMVRFFYRNYNANKHLANQSLQKYDVLKALQGIYNTIENKEARDELIKTGALTAFQNTESGYITTKEGAGSSDVGLFSAISSALKSR